MFDLLGTDNSDRGFEHRERDRQDLESLVRDFHRCVDRFLPSIRSEETRRRPPFSKHFRKRDKIAKEENEF